MTIYRLFVGMNVFSILFILLSLVKHDFHVSQCEIQYRPDEQHVAVAMSIFIDDLELALRVMGYDSLYLCTNKENEEANIYIDEYLNQTFQMSADERPIKLTLIGKEASEDLMAVWCYIEAIDVSPFDELVLENKVLLEQFDDQKNVVSFDYLGRKKQHFLFDRKDPVYHIEF